ncbi:uncharacterized protein A4U43_C01F11570 [Asparagus officinalis]|uniref:Uncharacterized protein n=1 Tax=Asparagus officinalis TaxID=4686 RepID=A0A5P1FP52_ASPOF|nr:uncharacterized protein A4U43_C01F11570 [Asparagus officinalis]
MDHNSLRDDRRRVGHGDTQAGVVIGIFPELCSKTLASWDHNSLRNDRRRVGDDDTQVRVVVGVRNRIQTIVASSEANGVRSQGCDGHRSSVSSNFFDLRLRSNG